MAQSIITKMAAAADGFDVAAGVGEALLNNFFSVHYATEHPKASNVYKGSGDVPSLKLKYAYDIQKPATIDLNPIAEFKNVYKRYMLRQPEVLASKSLDNRMIDFLDTVPPNLKVHVPLINLTITFQPPTAPAPININLKYSFVVTGFADITGANQIQITPIEASVGDPQSLTKQINEFKKTVLAKQTTGDNCYEYEELIKFIVNQTIADRISAFIINFPLPTPISLFDTVNLSNLKLDISDNFINITAKADPVISSLESNASNFDMVYDKHQTQLFINAAKNEIETRSKSFKSASDLIVPHENDAAPPINKGLYLMFSARFFQILADKFLNINEGKESCGTWTIFEGCSSYFLKLNNPVSALNGSELNVNVNFSGGGELKARAHLHCITTPWASIGADVTAVPAARVKANFYIENTTKSLFISAGTKPFLLKWHVNFIWPISEIAEQLLDLLTNAAELLTSLLGIRFHRELVSFPNKFPGTSFSYDTNLNKDLVNINGNLALLGDIIFKA